MNRETDPLPESFFDVIDAPNGPPPIVRGRKKGSKIPVPYIDDVLKLGPGQFRRIRAEILDTDKDPTNDPTGIAKACGRIMAKINNAQKTGVIPFNVSCRSDRANKCVAVYRVE